MGRLVVERLLLDDDAEAAGRRAMTRDGTSETAMRLRALGAEIVVGDATREEDCARACRGADAVVAAFGARRMSRAGDAVEKSGRWRGGGG